jgi:acetylornithine deacetylase
MSATVEILKDLIGFATVSRDPNRDLIDYVAARLEAVGADWQVIPDADGGKANLFATAGPRDIGGVMLSGHTDVVPVDGQDWRVPPFTCTESDGRYYGRGTADMKGFVAAAINAFETAARGGLATPLHLALSYDEELGCLGVRSMIDMLAAEPVRPVMCIVGEPTEMGLATGHKGKTVIHADCTGMAAHSSLAPLAVNAVHLACDLVAAIRRRQQDIVENGQHDAAYNIPYSTLHVGRIEGGLQVNIVPRGARVEFEIRNLADDDPQTIIEAIRADIAPIIVAARQTTPAADISLTVVNSYPGLETALDSEVVTLLQELTGVNATCKVAFGTEGGLFARDLGIPTIICGPGSMDQGHKPDEFVTAAQLALCDDMLASLTSRLQKGL